MCRSGNIAYFTPADVQKHDKETDCWLIVDGNVYNVTRWAKLHPGGEVFIHKYAGKDASDVFAAYHRERDRKLLKGFQVGVIRPDSALPVSPELLEFRELRSKLWTEGYFEPKVSFHVNIVAGAFTLLAACVALLVAFPQSFLARMAAAICLGEFWQQCLLFSHDACHTGITRRRKWDHLSGFVLGNMLAGVSASWWTIDHNEHHVFTNTVHDDPSFGVPPFVTAHFRQLEGRRVHWLQRFCVRMQAVLYLPMCLFAARYNLHLIGLLSPKTLLKHKLRDMFGVLFYMFYCYWLCQLAPAGTRLTFFATANLAVSVLHLLLNLNHYPAPVFGDEAPFELGWLKHQLGTTFNVCYTTSLADWFFGGLNLQIEHHLFPSMPRRNLRKAQPLVRALCQKFDVPYTEVGFWEANWDIIKCLDRVRMDMVSGGKSDKDQ